MLVGDAESWWYTLLEIIYENEPPTWEEFTKQFKQAYILLIVSERKMNKFLDLTQRNKNQVAYVVQSCHLERYYPQVVVNLSVQVNLLGD